MAYNHAMYLEVECASLMASPRYLGEGNEFERVEFYKVSLAIGLLASTNSDVGDREI